MRADSLVFGISGILFGVIVGWVLGSQQVRTVAPAAPAPVAQTQAQASAPAGSQAVPLDPQRVKALESVVQQNPRDAQPRIQLANLYFDAEQYPQAITYYEQAMALDDRDPNVSTDLGVAYYYTNQPDRAIAQFTHSLSLDARHTKTLLNLGIVRAFGKQDLAGAQQAWEQVVAIAPSSPEAQAAQKGLDGLKAAHAQAPSQGAS
jgi:tetratricopeptide (TPR) repeat protein